MTSDAVIFLSPVTCHFTLPVAVIEAFARVVAELRGVNKIFLAAHIQPDGDCLGSQLGLAWALRGMGKTVTLSLDDRLSETFNYLPGIKEIEPRVPGDQDLFVYVDGSDRARYGRAYDEQRIGARTTINIDHHVTNEYFANINLVDVSAASTAEIIYDLVTALGVELTSTIAQCLLTGILTDTLGFRTSGTTPETLDKATALVRQGASIAEIIDRVYNRRSFNGLRLLGRAIADARLDGNIIWSQVSQATLKELGINNSGTGGIVNMLLTVADAGIAFLLSEREDGRVDLSLRSRLGVDISGVAFQLGGGGHKQAAGANLSGPLDTAAARVLTEIKKNREQMDNAQ